MAPGMFPTAVRSTYSRYLAIITSLTELTIVGKCLLMTVMDAPVLVVPSS